MTCCQGAPMSDDSDHPFRVIDGGAQTPLTPRVSNVLEFEGARLVLHGHTKVWELDDPGAWSDVPLFECPSIVAFVLLGLGGPRALFTPGEAVDTIQEALERHGELTPGRAHLLGAIPRESSGFSQDVAETASLMFWWGRWWESLQRA